jgi:hypothetical protein
VEQEKSVIKDYRHKIKELRRHSKQCSALQKNSILAKMMKPHGSDH